MNQAEKVMQPNCTMTPNFIYDHCLYVLSPAEFKVISAIVRKTYGWHKKFDRISLKQIESLTGLSRKGIIKCLDVLIEKNFLIKIKSKTSDGDDAPNQYEINTDYSLEQSNGNCMGIGNGLCTPQAVNTGNCLVVNTVHTQNKLYTKENITKEEEVHSPDFSSSKSDNIYKVAKKKKPKDVIPKNTYLENVFLTEEQHKKLLEQYGEKKLNMMIEILSDRIHAKGYTYDSHYHVLKPTGWIHERYQESITNAKTGKLIPREIDIEEIEKRREIAKQFIHKNWKLIRDQSKYVTDKVDHVCVENDKIYYKDVKFHELFNHSIKKLALEGI